MANSPSGVRSPNAMRFDAVSEDHEFVEQRKRNSSSLSADVQVSEIAESTGRLLEKAKMNHDGNVQCACIAHLVSFLQEEKKLEYPCGEQFLASVHDALVIALASAKPSMGFERSISDRLKQAVHYMRENLGHSIAVGDIAEKVGFGATAFAKRFKLAYGSTPYRFLLGLRIEMCKGLLRKTKFPIIDIAVECGFSTSQHMATAFRRVVGVPPSLYRLQHQKIK